MAVKKPPREQTGLEVLEGRLEEMDRKLERLRGLYESFFMGIERAPPNVPRRELNRLILEVQADHIPNASLRFRFQSLMQRWVLMTTYWNRTMREIEAGTYRRDMARAQRNLAEKTGVLTEEQARAMGIPANRVKAFLDRHNRMAAQLAAKNGTAAASKRAPGAPQPGAPAAQAAPAAPAIAGLSDDLDAVYRRYLDTHRKANDPRPALTLEKIRERLGAQIPKILAERNCKKVKIDVAVEDGKVRLKAWPVNE